MGLLHRSQVISLPLTGTKTLNRINGFADHIGIVEYVENGLIHTIEGNSGYVGTVKRNVYRIGHGNIRGFATPRYR